MAPTHSPLPNPSASAGTSVLAPDSTRETSSTCTTFNRYSHPLWVHYLDRLLKGGGEFPRQPLNSFSAGSLAPGRLRNIRRVDVDRRIANRFSAFVQPGNRLREESGRR